MALNVASLNVRGLRDSSKCAHLLGELKNLGVDACMQMQETHFTCECRLSGAGKATLTFTQHTAARNQRWGLSASWTQPWCWCWRCFCRWRGPAELWPMLPWKVSSFVWLRFMRSNIAAERVSFFSSVGAVPGRYEAASLNGVIGMRSLIPR